MQVLVLTVETLSCTSGFVPRIGDEQQVLIFESVYSAQDTLGITLVADGDCWVDEKGLSESRYFWVGRYKKVRHLR